MTDEGLVQASRAVEDILSKLEIIRVVYVDDANSRSVTIENVVAAVLYLRDHVSELIAAFPELESVPGDQEVLAQKARRTWVKLDQARQDALGKTVIIAARRIKGGDADDVADASILSDLVPKAKLTNLSPSQWEEQRERLLSDCQSKRTLFLFDRDFGGHNPDGGIRIIASLFARTDINSLLCGLVTHTVTPENQLTQWKDLSEEHGIPEDRFVVIPKLHLSRAPILFAQALKFAALSPDFAELKSETKKIIEGATSAAATQVEGISIYDLDHIVFQESTQEGLWEPDMLFRLYALFHRLEARQRAHEGKKLESIAAKLRAVSAIPTNCKDFSPPSNAWKLQHQELYEPEEHINGNHLPIELGDIFLKTGSSKRYILLAQPCDLVVRSEGEREPEIVRVPLAEVASSDEEKPYTVELSYFDESPNRKWYVRLKRVHFVRISILDLCVFNEDGVSRFYIHKNAPPGIRPTWNARYKFLSKEYGPATRMADMMIAPVAATESREIRLKRQIAHDIKIESLLFKDDLFEGNLIGENDTRALIYDCKRIGRLSRARAMGLLMAYTATLGRPAYERGFEDIKLDAEKKVKSQQNR